MIRMVHRRWPRRSLMILVITVQLVILASTVISQEINRLFDSGPGVELEIPDAHARKDPFRGASISGRPALDLQSETAPLPRTRLEPGDRVSVFFNVEPGGRPRIAMVERTSWGGDPPFRTTRFSIPGTVRRKDDEGLFSSGTGMVARIGSPPVLIELDFPAAIPIDESALQQLSRPSVVRASLRHGFMGHRYFNNVRLSGQAWTDEMSFTYDELLDRLVVFAPEEMRFERGRRGADQLPRTSMFTFDGLGGEVGSVEVPGRLIDGAMNPADGTLWALVSIEPLGHSTVYLVKIGKDGTILQRGPQVGYQRIVGFDAREGSLWISTDSRSPSPATPYFVDRLAIGGARGPRLGPFLSKPRRVLRRGQEIWVIEPSQHRVSRFGSTGAVEQEYRDVNHPTEIALADGSLFVIEAAQTQLSKFSIKGGQLLWRIPRFQGLDWILPEPGTDAGWIGAYRFEGGGGGLFRFHRDGRLARLPAASTPSGRYGTWNPPLLSADAVRAGPTGRFYIREGQTIVILAPDGTKIKQVKEFRFATEQRVRN